jgi:uncharacterized membrane protein YbhN (UPF0104 family)
MTETTESRISRKGKVWNTIKILLAVLLIAYVISRTDLKAVRHTWQILSQSWLLLSVLCFVVMTIIKALEYRALIDPPLSFWNVLNIIVMQNAISNFVSNAAGVVSYMSMFRAEHGVRLSRSAVAFIVVKVGDLVAILCMLTISMGMIWSKLYTLHGLLLFLSAGILAALLVFLTTLFSRQWLVGLLERFLAWSRLVKFEPVQRVLELLKDLGGQEQSVVMGMLLRGVVYSGLYFSLTIAWFYATIRAFSIPIIFPEILFISAMLQVISFIPIQVFGGLGVTEVSSLYLYGLFGVPQVEISAALIGIRIYNTLLNALTLLYIPFGRAKK